MRKWTMKTNDDFIKNALKKNVQRIDDNSFTERIVQTHLAKKQIVLQRPFVNFMSLIIGLSAVVLSFGIVLLIRYNGDWIQKIGLTEQHGLLILALSFVFLIYNWMEELILITHCNRSH